MMWFLSSPFDRLDNQAEDCVPASSCLAVVVTVLSSSEK